MTRRLWIAGVASLAFVALGGLVAIGACSSPDQFAVDHLMPGLYPYFTHDVHWSALGSAEAGGRVIVPLSSSTNPNRIINRVADVAYIPEGGLTATLLYCLCAIAALVRGWRLPAVVGWLGAYGVGNVLELLGKTTIARPPLHAIALYGSPQVWKFDTSFPSGHTIRALLLAAFVASVFPSIRWLAAAWAAAVMVLLVVAGTHTPSDVLGGLLAATALVMLARDAEWRFERRRFARA